MKRQSWERVAAALCALGCQRLRETELQVTVCRATMPIQRIRKVSPVPVPAQRHLLAALGFTEAQFLAALVRVG